MVPMNQESQRPCERRVGRRFLLMAGLALAIVTLALVLLYSTGFLAWDLPPKGPLVRPDRDAQRPQKPVTLAQGKLLTVWWDALPDSIRSRSKPADDESNIHPADYTGPAACRPC